MTNVIVAVLTITYILVAFVAPLAAIVGSIYWAYSSYAAGRSLWLSILFAIIMILVLLIALSYLKKLLKKVMNKVDLGDDVT